MVTCMNITIRDVDDSVFRDFKAEAVRDDTTLGNAITMAMKLWLKHYKRNKRTKRSILSLKSFDWGEGSENSSTEVDEILYGG